MKTVSREFVRELIDFAPTDKVKKLGFAETQLDGTVALFNMLARNKVAYLADEVGMGKTYVALGVMSLVRYFDPHARIVVIAPRENIQLKWIKELRNFVRINWKIRGNRVKSLQGEPAWEPVACGSLVDFIHEALLHADRDFFLRMTSFSLALKDPDRRRKRRKELRRLIPWVDSDALSARTPEGFRDAYGAAINAAVPHADLVIVDEGHNLKHGFSERGSIRNRVMGLAFGHPDGQQFAGDWYGPRAERLLVLSATPFESDYGAIQRQLDVFGFGDAKLTDSSGRAPVNVRRLVDDEVHLDDKRDIVSRLMIRRVSGLTIAGERHTKNMYRREWRMGGYEEHDEPMQIDDPRQRLVVALMQKKVAEVLQDERFNNSFQIGMLSSFESFLESLGRSQRLAKIQAQPEEESEEGQEAVVFDGNQTDRADERRGIDTQAVGSIADSYRRQFGTSLPHPKLDATADSLADAFETGEKALVFVRRVRTVDELGAKLDRHFDGWIRGRMESALPELQGEIDGLFERYERERVASPGEPLESQHADPTDIDADERSEARHPLDEEDEGSDETFFSWFFRGQGPSGVLSGAAFQKNRLSGQASVFATLFDEDFVSWLLGRPADPIQALGDALGTSRDELIPLLRDHAYRQFRELSKRASGYPRSVVYEAYQIAGLTLLTRSQDKNLAEKAQTVLDERFQNARSEPLPAAQGFPDPAIGIGVTSIISELVKRPKLRSEVWPSETGPFRDQFRRSEQRRELLSAMGRLGAAYVDLYLLAIQQLGSFDPGRDGDSDGEDAASKLAQRYVDLLEKQSAETGFHAFRELAGAAENFDLLVSVNFPEAPGKKLHELAYLYSATLQKQVPVGRMAGGVNKRLVRQFRMPGFPLVLVSTDVLQEGEDLHTFCRRVVHYGITWTPSAIEQRTGRIDRIGSLVQRELDGTEKPPAPDEWLQVFYPHLRDTVEVLQVRRVLRRLNRFIALIHKQVENHEDFDRYIDVSHEILEDLGPVPVIEGLLQSAFPVREEWLNGDLRKSDVEIPNVGRVTKHLSSLWKSLCEEWEVEPVRIPDELTREGRAGLIGRQLAPNGSEFRDQQQFELTLRSQAAGDATLLRCRSVAGHLNLTDDKTLDELYDLQIELGHSKFCVEPDLRGHDEVVSVHHEMLFSTETTQLEEVVSLIARTSSAACRIHRDLIMPRVDASKKNRQRPRSSR